MSEFERLKKQKDEIMARDAVKITSCVVNRIVAERDSLRSLLATERDLFGKQFTEMQAKLARMEVVIKGLMTISVTHKECADEIERQAKAVVAQALDSK